MPDPALLTPADAARFLAVSRSTIYVLLQRGDLPSLKVGGARRIRRADLEAFLERCSTRA